MEAKPCYKLNEAPKNGEENHQVLPLYCKHRKLYLETIIVAETYIILLIRPRKTFGYLYFLFQSRRNQLPCMVWITPNIDVLVFPEAWRNIATLQSNNIYRNPIKSLQI